MLLLLGFVLASGNWKKDGFAVELCCCTGRLFDVFVDVLLDVDSVFFSSKAFNNELSPPASVVLVAEELLLLVISTGVEDLSLLLLRTA